MKAYVMKHTIVAILIAGMLAPPVAYAQPAPATPASTPPPAQPAAQASQDEPLYNCAKRTGPVRVSAGHARHSRHIAGARDRRGRWAR